jgi:hypothetical protein
MAERLPEPPVPQTYYEPVGPTPAVGRKNIVLGLALFAIALLMAGGAVVVSLIYLHFD